LGFLFFFGVGVVGFLVFFGGFVWGFFVFWGWGLSRKDDLKKLEPFISISHIETRIPALDRKSGPP